MQPTSGTTSLVLDADGLRDQEIVLDFILARANDSLVIAVQGPAAPTGAAARPITNAVDSAPVNEAKPRLAAKRLTGSSLDVHFSFFK